MYFCVYDFIRFIPTYVGHTARFTESMVSRSVHPHIRGAYALVRALQRDRTVHPHIRGAYGCAGSRPGRRPRFIPTYVGHTWMHWSCGRSPSVHPHIRGAYSVHCTYGSLQNGSSPHTWGILVLAHCFHLRFRFIPTYVGHTLGKATELSLERFIPTYVGHTGLSGPPTPRKPVHPHIRGAYIAISWSV